MYRMSSTILSCFLLLITIPIGSLLAQDADFGDAPDGIPSCQFSLQCLSPPTLYPTLLNSLNAPPGRNAPFHMNPDPNASVWFGVGPTWEPNAFQPCCDWISDGCDMDDGPMVLCLGGGCASGVVVAPGGPCLERALGTFGPYPGNPTTGFWVIPVSVGPFAGGPGTYFVNVAVDWDLSTAFGDAALEWPLQDEPVAVGPWQTQIMTTLPFPVITTVPPDPDGNWNILPFWTRFLVSEQPIGPDFPAADWDGSGPMAGFVVGETEDWVVVGDPGTSFPWTVREGVDLLWTPPGGGTLHDFSSNPIPADFFAPGSDPFVGTVLLGGAPIVTEPPGILDPTDTIIRRMHDAIIPGPGGFDDIPIELLALNLISVNPIVVTYNGGQNPELWDLQMNMSTAQGPQFGAIRITAGECGAQTGGTFDSILPIQPRFVFTRQDDHAVRVFDYGELMLPAIELHSQRGRWLPFNPDLGAVRAQPLVPFDHDGDPFTPLARLPVGSSDFALGVAMLPCHASACLEPVSNIPRSFPWTDSPTTTRHAVIPAFRCEGRTPCRDMDGDGVPDLADNCPETPNPLQEDRDGDGIGDICDNLPDYFNNCQDPAGAEEAAALPSRSALEILGPNPTSDRMSYAISLPGAANVQVRLFNVSGQLLKNVMDRRLPAGRHAFRWDAEDAAGARLPSGVYYMQLVVEGQPQARKLVVNR